MFPQTENVVAMGSFRYTLHPKINFFVNSKFAYGTAQMSGTVTSFNDYLPVSIENPFIPSGLKNALIGFKTANPEYTNPGLLVTRDFTDMGRGGSWVERNTIRTVAGVEGTFNNGWRYEVSVNFGSTNEKTTSRDLRIDDRMYAAIDVVEHPVSKNMICRSDLVPLHAQLEADVLEGKPVDTVLLDRLRELDPSTPPPTSPYPGFRGSFFNL